MSSTYLSFGPQSGTSQKIFTFSLWFKRSGLGTSQWLVEGYGGGSFNTSIYLSGGNALVVFDEASTTTVATSRLFRDTNAWYNAVVAVDTTQSTASDRIKIYINGVQETSFSSSNYPAQNSNFYMTGNVVSYYIGKRHSGDYFDGSISHVHQVDGIAYVPTTFGETDATTGEWKIKTSPTISDYGNNGYFILKDGNSVTDQSGKGNNWTVGGGTLTNTEDCPSNVFATLNPLDMYYGNSTLSNGNNTQNQSASAGNYAFIPSTLGFNSGKWYWEMKCVSGHSDNWYGTGITSNTAGGDNHWLGSFSNDYGMYGYSYGGGLGSSYTGGTRTNQGLSFTAGDIIGVAVDCDNLAIYFSKNGTWMSNASSVQCVPTSGSSKTGNFYTITAPSSTSIGFYFPALCYFDAQTAVQSINFGNGYFGTTAVASAGTNASGNGIFEYDVPTGYTALSTKGLNL